MTKEKNKGSEYISTRWEDIKKAAEEFGVEPSAIIYAKEQTKTNKKDVIRKWLNTTKVTIKAEALKESTGIKIVETGYVKTELLDVNEIVKKTKEHIFEIEEIQTFWEELRRKPKKYIVTINVDFFGNVIGDIKYYGTIGGQTHNKATITKLK